jgi:predicted nucleotide-binding protein (sugar kinase/HSP70/actin superfamily)
MNSSSTTEPTVIPPKLGPGKQWSGYEQPPWLKKDRKSVTILYSFVERRKSLFLRSFFKRRGFKYIDMGDHIKEDVRYGREYSNRMECNPVYFTTGSLIRHLLKIEQETGLSKKEIAEKYIFLCGGGQCGPCRYGLYPQEYLKAANDAGFKNFRILIFSSDIGKSPGSNGHAFRFDLQFRINMAIAIILADLLYAAECALRPYAVDKQELDNVLTKAEDMLCKSFDSRLYLFKLPKTLRAVGQMFAAVKKKTRQLPLIFVTGEFFSNLANSDANYHLRRFISNEGCEVFPGSFTQRIFYDNWRRTVEAKRGIEFSSGEEETKQWQKVLKKQKTSNAVIRYFYKRYEEALNPSAFGARTELHNLDELSEMARELYHPELFGGEGNLEIAEALHMAGKVDGFISTKPFGCMPSSGISDGVQAKVTAMHPELNFLSIETSGDNDVNILSRVSMLLLKAKQSAASRTNDPPIKAPEVRKAPEAAVELPRMEWPETIDAVDA